LIFKTLHGKLSVILLGLLCLIGCLLIPLTLFTAQRYRLEVNQKLNRPLAASLASHLASQNLLSQDPAVLTKARAEIKSLMVINPNIDVYLIDAQGNVLVYSGAPEAIRHDRVSVVPLRRFLGQTAPLPIFGDDPRVPDQQEVFSVAPITIQNSRETGGSPGYVYVILSSEHPASVAGLLGKSYIMRSSVWGIVAVLVVVSLTGFLLFRLLTRRLRRLTVHMEAFQGGVPVMNLLPPVPAAPSQHDEINRLELVYVQMSARIGEQMRELALADRHRREMVSNVSHDLRTPLSALQGYLETLLIKESSLTAEEQRGYLQIALRHSERLAKLVGELFELARLDSREVQVHPEPFSLSELVQDVVQQHQLSAEQKHLQMTALLTENLPFVFADIGLIERVLENFLENALRYTPEGGSVIITMMQESGSIAVQIADTGIGIRQEDLPHIFERFYRVPDQLEKPGCAGLGLAIAKRILELHGSTIAVHSVPDLGTTFLFHLPIHPVVSQADANPQSVFNQSSISLL